MKRQAKKLFRFLEATLSFRF